MKNDSPQLRIIGQLAREYDEKYRDLEKLISQTQPQDIPLHLKTLSEHAVNRFRSAQFAILSIPGLFEGKEEQTPLLAMEALCRAFDEMHILFNFLFDSNNTGSENGEEAQKPSQK